MYTELVKAPATASLLPNKAQLAILDLAFPPAARAIAAQITDRMRQAAPLIRTPMSAVVGHEPASRSFRP